jgi:four helix bundle protein
MLNSKSDLKLRAYHFSLKVINLVADFPNSRMYWVFSDRILRAGTSIGVNIVEAKSSSSKREFIRYYEIALKSANETKYWL